MAKRPICYHATDGTLMLTLKSTARGRFTVTSPFVPGLKAQVRTLEAAFQAARDAIEKLKESRGAPRRSQ